MFARKNRINFLNASLALTLLASLSPKEALANASTALLKSNQLVETAKKEAHQSKHFDAIKNFSKAIELNPNNHHAYFYRARSRKSLRDYQSAVEDYSYAIKLNPKSSMAYTERGFCLSKLDMKKQAIKDFNKAITLDNNNYRAFQYRSEVKYKEGDFQGALNDFNRVLKLKPQNSSDISKFLFPKLNLVKKKDATELKVASQDSQNSASISLETEPTGPESEKKKLARINNKAAASIRAGKFEQAVKLLEPITESNPDYDYGRRNLTIALNNFGLKLARHNPNDSMEKFRLALYYTPGEATARKNLNAILSESGKNPEDYNVRLTTADELLKAGNLKAAFVEYTEALRLRNTAVLRRKLAEICLELDHKKDSQEKPPVVAASPPDTTVKINPAATIVEEKKSSDTELNKVENPTGEKKETDSTSSKPAVIAPVEEKKNDISSKLASLPLPAPAEATKPEDDHEMKAIKPQFALSKEEILNTWSAHMEFGQKQFSEGDYVGAENSFDKALALAETLGPESRELGMSLEKLAEVYIIHKKVPQAYSILARALTIFSSHHEKDDPRLVGIKRKMEALASVMN